jgi:hypothetical protein
MTQIFSVPIIKQGDAQWKDRRLGDSTVSIGGYGCAIASLAMLGAYSERRPPEALDRINDVLLSTGGYYNRNFLRWSAAGALYPRLVFKGRLDIGARPARDEELRVIYERLARGTPVIIYVDMSHVQPGLQQHFVIATGFDPDSEMLIIHDPWHGDAKELCPRYGKTVREAVHGIILFDILEERRGTRSLPPLGPRRHPSAGKMDTLDSE